MRQTPHWLFPPPPLLTTGRTAPAPRRILEHLSVIRAAHVVLASASPRRYDLLNGQLGINARVQPSQFAEDLDKSRFTPHEYVQENARIKAIEVFESIERGEGQPPSLVIGADTVVVLGDRILEKPPDAAAAKAMLRALSDAGTHEVCTGAALVYHGHTPAAPDVHVFVESTAVRFARLSDEEIDAYVASGEPMDKAGGYGIQARGGAFVAGIVGDYSNVVGFPLHRFCSELDVGKLRAWVDSAAAVASDTTADALERRPGPDGADTVVNVAECADEDECGLPSD